MKDDRKINIKNIFNIRDLGGLKNKDNKIIKDKLIIRSSALDKLDDEDISALKDDYNLKKIIDLRLTDEVERKKDADIVGVEYLNLSILPKKTPGISRGEKVDKIPSLKETYKSFVLDKFCEETFSKALNIIINNRNGSILYHCSAGKDRTGILTAYILYLLDVDEKIIIQDYLLSNIHNRTYARKAFFEYLKKTKNLSLAMNIHKMFVCKKEYINSVLDLIYKDYPSVKEYLFDRLHIDPKEVETFKEYMLHE